MLAGSSRVLRTKKTVESFWVRKAKLRVRKSFFFFSNHTHPCNSIFVRSHIDIMHYSTPYLIPPLTSKPKPPWSSDSPLKLRGRAKMSSFPKNVLNLLLEWVFWWLICSRYKHTHIRTHTHLLHSMSSGQDTPNISMSLWHSSLARWQRERQGMDTWPYTTQTGVYRAHKNILRSGLHCRFTMGWNGWERRWEKNTKHLIHKLCYKNWDITGLHF